ncbi:possible glycosyltransferase [uncultured Candidatus Thioglobus sp.]|nr:possible glycosyltransferase [uncultured Candidatus Thioglobus sp.]
MNTPEKIAILLPCYNEEVTLNKVINDFKTEFPDADIFLYDNNSTDNSVAIAKQNEVIVRYEFRQGKGNVVRSMFKQVEADIYIMADTDDAFCAKDAHKMIEKMQQTGADMIIGNRMSKEQYQTHNKRRFHGLGNNLVRWLINKLFQTELTDIMTGYRVFNRHFVKNIPILSSGFEVETEMTLHAIDKNFHIVEVPIDFKDRPENSHSSLNTFSDGLLIIKTIFWLFKDYKPLGFFSLLSLILFFLSIFIAAPVIMEFIETSLVPRLPTAVLALGIMVLSVLSLFVGFILDTIARQHKFNYELNLKQHSYEKPAIQPNSSQ